MPGWDMVVRGRVQGVGFRWFVLDCALRHNINGYVKNQSDGTVKIIAVGSTEDILSFQQEIEQGNRHSQIQSVDIAELAQYHEYEEFFIA